MAAAVTRQMNKSHESPEIHLSWFMCHVYFYLRFTLILWQIICSMGSHEASWSRNQVSLEGMSRAQIWAKTGFLTSDKWQEVAWCHHIELVLMTHDSWPMHLHKSHYRWNFQSSYITSSLSFAKPSTSSLDTSSLPHWHHPKHARSTLKERSSAFCSSSRSFKKRVESCKILYLRGKNTVKVNISIDNFEICNKHQKYYPESLNKFCWSYRGHHWGCHVTNLCTALGQCLEHHGNGQAKL